MRVQAVLKPRNTLLGPHVPERLFFGYEGFQDGFKDL
jgi:hypothetical protein